MDERQLMIALNASERIDRAALCRLCACLDSDGGLDAPARDLGVPPRQLRRALALRSAAPSLAAREARRAERRGGSGGGNRDAEYPSSLLDLALPPPVLYCRGEIPDRPAVAIVGSRGMDAYGERAARLFAGELASGGVTVVSGFARGVDTTAHRAALDAGGQTLAVLGCGLDIDYPKGNAELATDVSHQGALLSEFPFGAQPRAWRFPIRNRVIAALAVGTLVIQATFKSGSLITAHAALELGRDVYAVPGSIFAEGSTGTNALIADGALPARSPRDILESLSLGVQQQLFPPLPPLDPLTSASQAIPETVQRACEPPPKGFPGRVWQALAPDQGRTADELATTVGKPVEEVLSALLQLELIGRARREPGPVYLR